MNRSRRLNYLFGLASFLFFSVSTAFGQDANSLAKGYVKMEVGAMGLHCPFLGATLREQLSSDTAYSELKVDKSDHFLTFAFTKADSYTAEYFQNIAVRVGYPAEIITITLYDGQPPIQVREE